MKPEEAAERILVVPTNVVRDCNNGELFEGFHKGIAPFERVLDPAFHTFRRRGDMEQDANWKQLIPYILIRYPRLEAAPDWFLSYQRSSDQAEKRLASKYSIGIGGHVTEADTEVDWDGLGVVEDTMRRLDGNEENLLWQGMVRELFEEINFVDFTRISIVGLLNEESTDVGKVHLGVVFLMSTQSTSVDSDDPYVQNIQWMTPNSLAANRNDYEGWSRHCIDAAIAEAI